MAKLNNFSYGYDIGDFFSVYKEGMRLIRRRLVSLFHDRSALRADLLGSEPMDKTEAEQKFEEYREYLHQEATRLASYIAIYRRLYELRAERLDEMNIAPAFFQVVIDALFSVIVLWVHKMFDEKSERGLANFLTFCELKELQRRKKYPDGHWMLEDRKPVTIETIDRDKERIRKLESLPSFKLRRD